MFLQLRCRYSLAISRLRKELASSIISIDNLTLINYFE